MWCERKFCRGGEKEDVCRDEESGNCSEEEVCGMRKEDVLSERVLVRGDNKERGENVL